MGVINSDVFIEYADRIARDYIILQHALDEVILAKPYFKILTVTDDPDVEIPMDDSADKCDTYFSQDKSATALASTMFPFTDLITGFENHMKRVEAGRTWDEYCSASGVRVSAYTNEVHYAKHHRYMLASNVFAEHQIDFGIASIMPPSGTVAFQDLDNFGSGDPKARADGSNFAASKVNAVLISDINPPVVFKIIGVDDSGEEVLFNTVPLTGVSGTVIVANPSGRIVDMTSVELVSGGTSGDTVKFSSIKERDVYNG